MVEKEYLNFDLLLEGSEGAYTVRVLDSPAGQDKATCQALFEPQQLDSLLGRIAQFDETAVRELGQGLYEAIFASRLYSLLQRSLDEAERQGKGLRIRLRLSDAPELINLPWETLYDPSFQRYFARSVDTPVVRFLDLPDRERTLEVQPPLRVLVMISSPQDFPALDAEAEWGRLKQALLPLEQKGLLVVEQLHDATLPNLQQRLRQEDYHIFHFLGHGVTDPTRQSGVLVFETDSGQGKYVDSQQLSTLLFDEKSIRLVVLNACQGAQTWASNPFGGVAQGLVQQGIPAVVAMQFPVSDAAAIAFSSGLYSALADYLPVDAALGEARKAIYLDGHAVEWATPVLFLRSDRAAIFSASASSMAAAPALVVEEAPVISTAPSAEVAAIAATPAVADAAEKTPVAANSASLAILSKPDEFTLPGKWLIVLEGYWEFTVDMLPSESSEKAPELPSGGKYTASLYYKPDRNWVVEELEGKWTYDPVKKRLALNGKFVANNVRDSLTLVIYRGQDGFYNGKDRQGISYTLTRVTGEFQPVGKWLITYDLNGPTEVEVEFLAPAEGGSGKGEFTAVENYKKSKRWIASDVSGQWTYDPVKKRLALAGKYAGSGYRFSITPYIQGWEYNHFTGKDHDGMEFSLTRVG
jgi:hypothetical protein